MRTAISERWFFYRPLNVNPRRGLDLLSTPSLSQPALSPLRYPGRLVVANYTNTHPKLHFRVPSERLHQSIWSVLPNTQDSQKSQPRECCRHTHTLYVHRKRNEYPRLTIPFFLPDYSPRTSISRERPSSTAGGWTRRSARARRPPAKATSRARMRRTCAA